MNKNLLVAAKKFVEPYGGSLFKHNNALVCQYISINWKFSRTFEYNNYGLYCACEWIKNQNQDVYRPLPKEIVKEVSK